MARGSAALPAAALAPWPALAEKGRGDSGGGKEIRDSRTTELFPEVLVHTPAPYIGDDQF